MNLITPPIVKPGSVAYVISPSAGIFPFAENRVLRAKKNLEELGLVVKIARNADKNLGYISSTIEDRVSDLHEAFMDNECTLIMAAIGGNHSNQLINKLDYELIRKNPKTFVGYSDNTVLHLALLSQAQLQTFYGPCFLNQFGEFPKVLNYTSADFKEVVLSKKYARHIQASAEYTDEVLDWFEDEDSKRPRQLRHNDGFIWWKKGSAEGWALPAAIPSLNHILGTGFMPDIDKAILFIDIPEGNSMYEGMTIADVDAWLTDLENARILTKIHGLVVGRPYKYNDDQIRELETIVKRVTKNYDIPILFNVDFGHTDPMITIPYGAAVRLDSRTNSLEFR